jgi:hypothetical protein
LYKPKLVKEITSIHRIRKEALKIWYRTKLVKEISILKIRKEAQKIWNKPIALAVAWNLSP